MYLSRKKQLSPLFDLVFGDDFRASAHFGFSNTDHLSQDDEAFRLSLELPGYQKDDFQIEIKDDQLFVSANFDDETNRSDRYRKSFRKVFNIDLNHVDVDKVSASYDAGILRISLPKSEKMTKKIAISVN